MVMTDNFISLLCLSISVIHNVPTFSLKLLHKILMYSKSDKNSILDMSNSELFFLPKNQEKEIKSTVAAQPSSKDPKGRPDIAQSSHLLNFQDFQDLPGGKGKKREHEVGDDSDHGQSTASSKPMLKPEVADDDDGFKTPTSLEHKIPAMITCPPAPKKNQTAQIFTCKEKTSVIVFKNPRRTLQFDGSREVEYSLSPLLLEDLSRRIKKSRREDGAE